MLPMVVGLRFSSLRRDTVAALPLAFQLTTGGLVVAMTVIGRKAVFAERANFAAHALLWHRATPFLKFLPSSNWSDEMTAGKFQKATTLAPIVNRSANRDR
jgi:hypothetical protein